MGRDLRDPDELDAYSAMVDELEERLEETSDTQGDIALRLQIIQTRVVILTAREMLNLRF